MQEEIKLIGRRIRLLRTAKNLTQTGLAKEMGISQTHLCNIGHWSKFWGWAVT